MKRSIAIVLLLSMVLSGIGCDRRIDTAEKNVFPEEKAFYKLSDIGSDVFRLTSDSGNDNIFYQEPNYFSPDNSKFLFRSDRGNGKYRLYLLGLETGEIIPLRENPSFGWGPTWSKDGKVVYIGEKNRIIIKPINFSDENSIKIPEDSWITFLHLNPSGDRLLFVEEGKSTHIALSTIKIDGSGYKRVYLLDLKNEFFVDHPTFIDDSNILFLVRGKNRNFTGDFNKPYITTLKGKLRRLPLECSHYDVNPKKDKILCGQEGYVIDLEGSIIKQIPELHGHGVWAPDGETFLMTGDPVPVNKSSQYFGKIVILDFSSDKAYNLVSHESTYNSSLPIHIQPNAQFSRDGKHVIYESENGHLKNSNIYMVSLK